MVDPEKYPGINVFVNLRNITDAKHLEKAESALSAYNLAQFYSNPSVIGELGQDFNFDLAHVKAIHKYLFQDLYPWAGEIRSYNMKIGIDIFTPPNEIEHYAELIAKEIKNDGYLRNTRSRAVIVQRVARYLGLLGMLHPFPEGNGRTQRAFLWQLTLNAGYTLNWSKVHQWENRATAQNVHREQDYSGMESMIHRILTPVNHS